MKRLFIAAILLTLIACKKEIYVSGIVLDPSNATLTINQTLRLTAIVVPENATNKAIIWKSSNSSVATVVDGLVTAVGTGSTTITAITQDGGFTATCAVTVAVRVVGVTVTPPILNLGVGNSETLTTTFSPGNATNQSVSWTSSNPSVATVTNNGVVTAVSIGTAIIEAVTSDGGYKATCTVIVNIFAGNGSQANPYLIGTAGQLVKFAELMNAGTLPYAAPGMCYKLSDNIDLSTYSSGAGWKPIAPFLGNFDGANHTVSNLYINRQGESRIGLFSEIGDNATVKNLGIVNANVKGGISTGGISGYMDGRMENCFVTGSVSGSEYVGGIAGDLSGGNMSDCYFTGEVFGSENNIGGVAGYLYGSSSMTNCRSTALTTVTGNFNVGGVVGYNGGTISSCSNDGNVSGLNSYAGGVIGVNGGVATACNNTGNIISDNLTGGVVGSNKGSITASRNTGSIMGGSIIGGVVGENSAQGNITACYNTGYVTGRYIQIGGVVGGNWGSIIACYNTGRVSTDYSYAAGGIAGSNDFSITACYWGQSTAYAGVGYGAANTTISFISVFTPSGSPAWGVGTGQTNGWWKTGTTNGAILPKLWWE